LDLFVRVCHQHNHFPPILSKRRKHILYEELNLFRIVSDFNDFLELFEANVTLGFSEILSHNFSEYFLFESFWHVERMRIRFENLHGQLVNKFEILLPVAGNTVDLKYCKVDEVSFHSNCFR
jgi:hypothetical protein